MNISVNGRFAFGICCLENARNFYQAPAIFWNNIIDELWEISESEFVDQFEKLIFLRPCAVNRNYSTYLNILDPAGLKYETESEYANAQSQFSLFPEMALIFDTLLDIKDLTTNMGTDEIGNSSVLEEVEVILNVMQSNGIPLPDITLFQFSNWSDEDGYGSPISRSDILGA